MSTNILNKQMKIGKLVIFVGSSGSGKDSLIYASFKRLSDEYIPVHRVRRWITRPNHHSERFNSVSKTVFLSAVKNNQFALWWSIYDTYYGVEKAEIDPHLIEGKLVLVNLSRTMCTKALELYPDAIIILVRVPVYIAEKRIHKRDREDGKNLEARLRRLHAKVNIPFPELLLQNDGTLDASTEVLVHYLKALMY